jgi:hypothetical protein
MKCAESSASHTIGRNCLARERQYFVLNHWRKSWSEAPRMGASHGLLLLGSHGTADRRGRDAALGVWLLVQ